MLRIVVAASLVSLAACTDAPPAPVLTFPQPEPKSGPVSAPALDPDHELVMRVRRALEEAGNIDVAAIDVLASDGVVSLWGSQATTAARSRAGELAAAVDGVKSVRNELVIVRGS